MQRTRRRGRKDQAARFERQCDRSDGNQEAGVYEFSITNARPKDYRLSVEATGYVFVNQNVQT